MERDIMGEGLSRITGNASRRRQRVLLRDIWTWVAPWLAGVLLACGTLLGFFTAAGAHGRDTYAAGFFTASLTLIALVWLVKRSCDRPIHGLLIDIRIERPESLLLLLALLAAIGIGGLFLAADAHGAAKSAGYTLFVVCLLFIAWNLKHYYDQIDSH
ncbi:MAG: hypothetical protein WCF13_12300 [Stellaceae bacterium]